MASKYKKNKVKFKWTKELVFLILGLLTIIGVTIYLSIPNVGDWFVELVACIFFRLWKRCFSQTLDLKETKP